MNFSRMLCLGAAVAVLMAFIGAGTASATQLTGAGGGVLGVGTEFKAENEGKVVIDPPFGAIECSKSTVAGKVTNAGSATTTVSGTINVLTFTECNATITVLQKGTWEFHTQGASNNNHGSLTWSGAEVTTNFFGMHCIFSTKNTPMGTVTGSAGTGGVATWDISATIPMTGGSSGAFCGSTFAFTGAYKFTNPGVLNIH